MINKKNLTAIKRHHKIKGKIEIKLKDNLDSEEKLSIYYTPGVGAVSQYIFENPKNSDNYLWTNNNLAVISDGSAVLGLGDIGPKAALAVMEGKSMIFKQFANIDAVPIVIDVHKPKEIIDTIKAISPSFGAINLEDIKAPECFEVEEALKKDLNIPVMHDDQHGTAVVCLAGLINATKLANKDLNSCKIVIVGAGAAGSAIARLINKYRKGAEIIILDSKGIISKNRKDLDKYKIQLLKISNPKNVDGDLSKALKNCDIFIGVSKPGILNKQKIKLMNKKPIVFAMANPVPEIYPDEAKKAGVFIIATGRSDFPNQINNALAFPGIFRGALDNKVNKITDEHKIKAAETIANLVKKPTPKKIVPDIFNKNLVKSISKIIS